MNPTRRGLYRKAEAPGKPPAGQPTPAGAFKVVVEKGKQAKRNTKPAEPTPVIQAAGITEVLALAAAVQGPSVGYRYKLGQAAYMREYRARKKAGK